MVQQKVHIWTQFPIEMNEWPNITLEVHSIWTHTIAFERTENQVKRTIIEWVMVGNSFCKHKDSATFRPDLETIMPAANLFVTITRSIPVSFAWFLVRSEANVYVQLLWPLLMPQKLHIYSRFRTHQKSRETNRNWASNGNKKIRCWHNSFQIRSKCGWIFVLAETISYHHSLNYCSFHLIFGAFKSDCMCSDAVHFKCDIWSLIHFYRKLGPNMHFLPAPWNWELRGYKGLVCLPDLFLHHSQGPDSSCFCTVHVASCCSSTIMPKSC